jgi:hypothetical protein
VQHTLFCGTTQIKKDIHRSFPKHVLFRDAEGNGQQALYNVLKNYSLYDTKTGYCQGMCCIVALMLWNVCELFFVGDTKGMGFLTGVLLMYMTEEDAFWMLIRIAENYEMAKMWEDNFPNLWRGKFVVERLLQQFMPRVMAHLLEEGAGFASIGVVADKWFLGWFLYTMPFHVVLRIWDALLGHGFLYIYRIILAIFKYHHGKAGGRDRGRDLYTCIVNKVF